MERVFYRLHSRVCTFGLQNSSGRSRRAMEQILLVLSICGFGALILLHVTFVHRPVFPGRANFTNNLADRCLASIPGVSAAHDMDVTHVVLIRSQPNDMDDNSRKRHLPFSFSSFSSFSSTAASITSSSPPLTSTYNTRTYTNSELHKSSLSSSRSSIQPTSNPSSQLHTLSGTFQKQAAFIPSHAWVAEPGREGCDARLNSTASTCPHDGGIIPSTQYSEILYSYSAVKGYLLLPFPPDNDKLRLTHQFVAVHPEDPVCFGEPFLQWLLDNWIGRDAVVHNWLLGYFADRGGFVYDPRVQRMYELPSATPLSLWRKLLSKLILSIQTTALFGITTALVSYTFRGTQERMLTFTHELSRRVRLRQPVVRLVVTHVLHNLVLFVPIMVGVLFFLVECYNGDKFLAFLVLSIVWVCEVYSIISLRSWEGIIYFPRVFFLLFCLFHIYYFSNPFGGFGYTAFSSVSLFMLHSMLFFWNRYELPAVALGWVTVDRPRMVSITEDDEEEFGGPLIDGDDLQNMNSQSHSNSGDVTPDSAGSGQNSPRGITTALSSESVDDGDDFHQSNRYHASMSQSHPSTSSFTSIATDYSYSGEEGSSGLQAIIWQARGGIANHNRVR